MIVEYPLLLVPTDLLATVVYTSLPVPCRGASAVAFHLQTATDTDVPGAAYVLEVRKNPPAGALASGWLTPAAATTAGCLVTGSIPAAASLAAATGGQVCWIHNALVAGASTPGGIIMWDEARIKVTGHATLTISGLTCRAQVVYAGESGTKVETGLTQSVIP